MIEPLSDSARDAMLSDHPEWDLVQDGAAIERRFAFADFSEAFAFMTRVALIAETMGHHPEWSNVYNHVSILLTTHDVDALSERDARMARAIDALLR